MNSSLLQIEERQKLYSSVSANTEQPPASIKVEQPIEPQPSTSQPSAEIAEASTSSQTAPSSSGRPLAAAWPSPPPSKRTARSGRAVVQPYSPPVTTRPVVSPGAESKRDFHSDHGREGTSGNASQPAPQQPETNAAAPSAAEKPPPLAGPNVMNIVVVAAECAPWSKTGGALLFKLSSWSLASLLVGHDTFSDSNLVGVPEQEIRKLCPSFFLFVLFLCHLLVFFASFTDVFYRLHLRRGLGRCCGSTS